MQTETAFNPVARRDAARWFTLGVGSVAVAGLFALYLAVARIPGLETALAPDPKFGHRGLIVHVNLALGVWFSSCIAALFCLLPGARPLRVTPAAQLLALAGVLTFSATMFMPDAEPLKTNYVPTLDHWLFVTGMALFGCAVAAGFADRRLLPAAGGSPLPPEARPGLRLAAFAYLLSILTILGAWSTQAEGLTSLQYYERLFWGGGHVQQWANVLAMVAVWLLLLSRVVSGSVINPRIATVLFVLLFVPALAGPVLTFGGMPGQHFTFMMRWGLFPAVSVFLLVCIHSLWRERGKFATGALRGVAFTGFVVSAVMTVAGFILGALIRSETTLVPAHYHMSLGAVTTAFMAVLLELLAPLGAPLPGRKSRAWASAQPVLYGLGTSLMAVGFGLAASERKTYGTEQVVRSTGEWAGLMTMGIGGVVSSVGGVVFLVLLIIAVRARRRSA
jgi:cytochrome c oxidase subunit I